MASQEFKVLEIRSGEHEGILWVSVGFASDAKEDDLLHFVCALSVDAQDRKLGHNSMYMERSDQGLSCYSGAEKIVVSRNSIDLKLNVRGRKSLALPKQVVFSASNRLNGWAAALKVFGRMALQECGRVLDAA